MLFLLALLLTITGAVPVQAADYRIVDMGRIYLCSAAEPAAAITQAGLTLETGDRWELTQDSIHILRAPRITVVYHGNPTEILWQPETVEALLARLAIQPGPEDRLNCTLGDSLPPGGILRIDQVTQTLQSSCAAIACQVLTCRDPELAPGTCAVLSPGQDGELLRTEMVSFVNGRETRRELLQEVLVRSPVPRILAYGPELPAETSGPVIGDGRILLPTGEVLTYTRTAVIRATAYTHTDEGCDMTTATGTLVHRGTVAVDPRYIPYGTRMFIQACDGSYTYGIAQAEDCGGDIKGDRMDLYLPSYSECMEFGRKVCNVYFLG